MRDALSKKLVGFIVLALNDSAVPLPAESRPAKITKEKYDSYLVDGAVLVHYAGSKYSNPDLGAAVQDRELFFDCVVLYKSLRDDAGEDEALDILEAVIDELAGKKHPDCARAFYPVDDGFLASDAEEGALQYKARFSCKAVRVEEVVEEDAALFVGITID